ncbi:hypothetical protein BIV23_01700 [Streptomyces monashensis]|uniref:Uncharacterized protein n=1 Tax=Streptomyces monashensis TaxID=1678012 RepID=A0A1S2QNI5_9ACTN|nr:hypothetical protein BIV23_01700 [Streptomyces monashensis]
MQRTAPPQRLVVHRQRLLVGRTGLRELVDETFAVEVLDRGDPRGVRVRPQVVSPLDEGLPRATR